MGIILSIIVVAILLYWIFPFESLFFYLLHLYCKFKTDKIDKKYFSEINKVVSFSRKIKLNYDCLSAIALELNEGEKFEETIKDLNIINTHDRKRQYDVQLFTEEGIIFTSENKELDLLNGDTNDIWVEDSEGNSINIEFSANNAIFDNKQNSFIVSGNNVEIYDDYEYVDKAKKDIYKNLHCAYIKFSQSYNDYLHYKLI